MKFAQNIHPTRLFGPTRLIGTWEYDFAHKKNTSFSFYLSSMHYVRAEQKVKLFLVICHDSSVPFSKIAPFLIFDGKQHP